jgi:hypothetical protein
MRVKQLVIWLVVFSASCMQDKHARNSYFDTKLFFEQEILRLQASKAGVQKGLWFDGKEQFIEIKDTVNWASELKPFTGIDLAADAFYGVFETDTVIEGNNTIMHYLARDNKEEIKSITLVYTQAQLASLTFMIAGENSLYSSCRTLRYTPDSGYVINGEQQVNFLTKTNYQAGAKWID